MRYFIAFFILMVFAAFFPAQAHYYAWKDADYDFTMAFPDTWKEQGGLPGNGRIRVLAPGLDGAHCTIYAQKDRRFMIYPRDYMTDVVAQEIQWDYWEQVSANYDDQYFYYDNYGALGASDARYTLVDYIDRSVEPAIRKRAWLHATLYGDLHMITHCASPIETFDRHASDFGQIVDSIQYEPQYATTYRGGYRDFLETKQYGHHWHEKIVLFFWPRKEISKATNCPRSENYKECLYKPKPLPIQAR